MMRRALILLLAALTTACAPRFTAGPTPAPSAVATVMLAGGPEGESAIPSAVPSAAPRTAPAIEKRPTLATAVMVPSTRMTAAIERLRDRELMIPVAGANPSKIEDSFTAGRDGERQHNAVDILAPRNTPV